MITIDGSQGEGGGQILRSALALSLVTGKPFGIEKIRARRKKPGLMRQHLTAVNAAVEVGAARVSGNSIGSQELTFAPTGLNSGQYHFSVGTAGSCTLVLQTVLPALMVAASPSEVLLEGGTHNPAAPPFDFLAESFLPLLNRMGPYVQVTLERPGFYPAGGGRMRVSVTPGKLVPLHLLQRGEIVACTARAIVSRLPRSIAEREIAVVKEKLAWENDCLNVGETPNSSGPGNVLVLSVASEQVTEVFTGFGEYGVSAETVAGRTVKEVREYLASGVPVGRHLADQLLLPLALAGGGSFCTLSPTAHTTTNIEVLRLFLDLKVKLEQLDEQAWVISIDGIKPFDAHPSSIEF
jgi:RNA 3'-terminal phosphate cyclase (ATP)